MGFTSYLEDIFPGFSKEAVDVMIRLLTLRPTDLQGGRQVAFTTAPWMWQWFGPTDIEVVNVNELLGVSQLDGIDMSIKPSASDIRTRALNLLQEAGWDTLEMLLDYRPTQKHRKRLDIACVDPVSQQIKLAVEIVSGDRDEWEAVPRVAKYCEVFGLDRMMLSDGNSFSLVDSHGNVEELRAIPSPNGESWPLPQEKCEDCFELQHLNEIIRRNENLSAIMDMSIPLRSLGKKPALAEMKSIVSPKFRSNHLVDLFMGYLALFPSVKFFNAILPADFATGTEFEPFRNFIVSSHPPLTIASSNLMSNSSRNFIQLGCQRGQTYFFNTNEHAPRLSLDEQGWWKSLESWMDQQTPEHGFRVDIRKSNQWSAARNDPAIGEAEVRLKRLGTVTQLEEAAEILWTRPRDWPRDKNFENGIPIVNCRSLQGGIVDLSESNRVQEDDLEDAVMIETSDLVISQMWTHEPKVSIYRNRGKAVAHSSVFVVRPRTDIVVPEFLCEYLRSQVAASFFEATASTLEGATRISRRSLGLIPVPIDLEFGLELGQVHRALNQLDDTRAELDAMKMNLFEAESKSDFQRRVSKIRHLSRLITMSVKSVHDTNFQISNYYPYPIAYGYRLLDGITNPAELYKQQLRVGENILAFLGTVALSIVDKDDRSTSKIDVKECWGGGISPGHWRDIVAKASAVFESYEDNPLASQIQNLKISKQKNGFGKVINTIIAAKNDHKHDRGPSVTEDFMDAADSFKEILFECLERLSFLTDYPIRRIVGTTPNRSGDKVTIESLLMRGDHPGVPQESTTERLTMDTSKLRIDDFYIDTGSEKWVPMFPFMVSKMCRLCKMPEVYFPDRWFTKKSRVELKSFERGHTVQDEDVSEGIDEWTSRDLDS